MEISALIFHAEPDLATHNLKLTQKLSSLLLENGYYLSNIFSSDWPNLLHSEAYVAF